MLQSEENRLREVPIPAPRGTIYDRNNKIIAENVVGYTVSVLAQSEDSLRGTLTRYAVAGVATFSGLSVSTSGIGFVIRAKNGALAGSTLPFDQIGRAPRLVVVSGDGQSGAPGAPLAAPIVVRTTTNDGHPVAGYEIHYGLVTAENVHNIAILGQGTIDGNRTKRGGPKTVAIKLCQHVTIRGITFTGARVPDHNGAGIRAEGRNLTVENSRFIDNEEGLLAGVFTVSTITIRNSYFKGNGLCTGSGCAHGVYVGKIKPPAKGWTAFFVELTYQGPGPAPFKFTTSVNVLPDTLPFVLKTTGRPVR